MFSGGQKDINERSDESVSDSSSHTSEFYADGEEAGSNWSSSTSNLDADYVDSGDESSENKLQLLGAIELNDIQAMERYIADNIALVDHVNDLIIITLLTRAVASHHRMSVAATESDVSQSVVQNTVSSANYQATLFSGINAVYSNWVAGGIISSPTAEPSPYYRVPAP